MSKQLKEDWYTRPVVFVSDVEKALEFYCKKLKFTEAWRHEEGDAILVTQVNRGSKCEVILADNELRSGMSRLFIELTPEELAQFKQEIKANKINATESHWGMPIISIKDPFGNELFFPTGE